MFLTDAEFLSLLGEFAVTGIITAVFFDIIRVLRIAAGSGRIAVFITDFLMTVLFALVVMFTAIENGYGKLRLYYFAAAALGLAAYFFTVGIITKRIAVLISRLLGCVKKYAIKLIYNPIVGLFSLIRQKTSLFFVRLHQKMTKYTENLHFGLKKPPSMLYNSRIGKLYANGGEERNVIKAKVRKKA